MFDVFFDLELTLCDRFPSFTPISLRRERAKEVFLLMKRLIRKTEREEKEKYKGGKIITTTSGKKILRKPAGDDWF